VPVDDKKQDYKQVREWVGYVSITEKLQNCFFNSFGTVKPAMR
jgi:hypothetical protein